LETKHAQFALKMPEISRFFGIVIAMLHREHGPAHFHARYGDQEVTVRLKLES